MLSILVYIFILSVYVVNGEEPHCSKFDFEEKVLEKMVRIEFEMEKLKQEMQKSVETVQKMNTQVETNVDIFRKKQEVINDQIGQLEGFKNKLSEEVKHELQTELASFKDVHVGFTVYKGDPSSGTGTPLKFLSTLYNSDASFNNLTGVFTCIHPGVYFFSATVMKTSTYAGSYYCYFMVNNIFGIRVIADDNNNNNSNPGSSASIVLRLNKNDTVKLGNCNHGSYMYSDGVSFTGFRISP